MFLETRTEILFSLIMIILAGIFGFVGMIFWDNHTIIRPIEAQFSTIKSRNEILFKEIALIKERQAKLEEKQLKNESIFKKIFEKFPDLAGLT